MNQNWVGGLALNQGKEKLSLRKDDDLTMESIVIFHHDAGLNIPILLRDPFSSPSFLPAATKALSSLIFFFLLRNPLFFQPLTATSNDVDSSFVVSSAWLFFLLVAIKHGVPEGLDRNKAPWKGRAERSAPWVNFSRQCVSYLTAKPCTWMYVSFMFQISENN